MRIYFRAIAAVIVLLFFISNTSNSQSISKQYSKNWLNTTGASTRAFSDTSKTKDVGPSIPCDLKILERPGVQMNSETIYLLKDIILNKLYGDTLQIQEDAKYEYFNLNEVGEVSFKTGNHSFWGAVGGAILGTGVGAAIAYSITNNVFKFDNGKSIAAFSSFMGATIGGGLAGFFIGKQIPKYKVYNFSELDPKVKREEMIRVINENQK